jgi:hypothetical protein
MGRRRSYEDQPGGKAVRLVPRPAQSAADVVTLRHGVRLVKPIHHVGRQWAIARTGLHCIDGIHAHHVEVSRLEVEDEREAIANFIRSRSWCDREDFDCALAAFSRSFATYSAGKVAMSDDLRKDRPRKPRPAPKPSSWMGPRSLRPPG